MTDRRAAAERKNNGWCLGIEPRLDSQTYGTLKTLFNTGRGGCACSDLRDYLTELYHAGRGAAQPVYDRAHSTVTSYARKERISLKLSSHDIDQICIIIGTKNKKEIAISIAAFVQAGYDISNGALNCNGPRNGVYV